MQITQRYKYEDWICKYTKKYVMSLQRECNTKDFV